MLRRGWIPSGNIGATARGEVFTGPERLRRWSGEQKRAIVLTPGAGVGAVARRADAHLSQLYRWRQELRAVPDGFAQVLIPPPETAATVADGSVCGEPAIEVEFVGKARVRIPGSVPVELAAAVVKVLARR